MLLSIGMMVKNEEKHLEECLQSLEPIREDLDSELIIVDTGSDDSTVEIAKKFTDKVYFHEWDEHFSEMRNTVISYSTGDWYFSLDGDEIVSNPETIINFFKSGKHKKYKTGFVTQKNYTDIKEEKFTKILVPRLFKNDDDFHFEGAVHNQPQFKNPIYELNTILKHYGYISSDEELMEKKFKRTATILKRELKKDPENVYYLYQLSRSYAMHGDNKEALKPILKAYNIIRKKNYDLKKYMNIYTQLAKMYMKNNRYGQVEKISLEALDKKEGYIDLNYYLAGARFKLNKKEESLTAFKNYIKLVENYDQTISKKDKTLDDETICSIETAYKYILILANDLNKELEYAIEKAFLIEKKQKLNEILKPFIEICLNNEEYMSLKKFFEEKVLDSSHLKYKFMQILENKRIKLDDEVREELSTVFSDLKEEEDYFLLNKIRLNILQENDVFLSNESLKKLNFNKKPNYFGDMIYYLLINTKIDSKEKFEILTSIKEEKIDDFIEFLNKKYDNLKNILLNFVNSNVELKDISEMRVKKSFLRYLLALNDNKENYRLIFEKYLDYGIKYIDMLYNKDILVREKVNELKNKEESFLLYMYLAQKVKEEDMKKYIQYLRKALNVYSPMKKGIEILLEEIENDTNQLNNYQKRMQENIEQLINNGNLTEAKNLLKKYNQNIGKDIEWYSMKAIIAIYKKNYKKAEKILKDGLNFDRFNFDILYNLGYLYEIQGRLSEAHSSYILAKRNCEEEKSEKELYKKLYNFENNNYNLLEDISNINENKSLKTKVVLVGTGEGLDEVLSELDYRFSVVAYSDIDSKSVGLKVDGVEILSLNDIANYNYDYIIITEKSEKKIKKIRKKLLKNNISDEKIYSFFQKNHQLIIEGFDDKIHNLIQKEKVELIITGMSYAEVGVDEKLFEHDTMNLALSAQDMYYDYKSLKYILSFNKVKTGVEHVITNLGYFCFDYDMSRKLSKNRVHRYYDYLKTTHNNNDVLGVKLLDRKYVKNIDKKAYKKMTKQKLNTRMDEDAIKMAKKYAKYHSNMNHPKIVEENKKIFNNYLQLLNEMGIKPTIVIFPVSRYYYDTFSYEVRDRFYNIINEFKEKYEFQILDYFDSKKFNEKDFWDGSHLNKIGAEKFTKMLKTDIGF